jgi:hypothetical protein
MKFNQLRFGAGGGKFTSSILSLQPEPQTPQLQEAAPSMIETESDIPWWLMETPTRVDIKRPVESLQPAKSRVSATDTFFSSSRLTRGPQRLTPA